MTARYSASFLVLGLIGASVGVAPLAAAAVDLTPDQQQWVMPRTSDGHPDLQGNWSNATITPLGRPRGQGPVLTPDQVAEIEGRREEFIEVLSATSDPDREAPAVGGVRTGDFAFDAASGGTGGYNYVYIDGGDRVAIYNGESRSSLVTTPADGRIPSLTPDARQRRSERSEFNRQFGAYDNPENRPLSDRCLMSFGSNAGPPMLPNYFYNNNYTIVQTADHIMIMTEMVHDVRIIRMGERVPLPEQVRPWMGDSWGHWEGDTLVIETTNLHPLQRFNGNPSDNLKVIERLTRVDQSTINYEFTIIDPETYTAEWGGEVPMKALEGLIYEYACHEGNYALGAILSGARYQERLEAEDQN
ncbi:MAG: hypothetical protein VYB51_03605 [Gemmatimonadota bacterium]|nr:hypothetical protein [Gemmatimonadota bacterium]